MQAAADGRVPNLTGDRNDGHHSIVSELIALIAHVQAGDFTASDRRRFA